MHDIAIDTRAALITSDNRFFRSNLLTELVYNEFYIDAEQSENFNNLFRNASLENFQFLTIEQTINDIASLIQVVKQDLGAPESLVILWGSGFGATLATWTRKKFSHLVDGVWSSSGIYEFIPHTNGKKKRNKLKGEFRSI